jgi:hypothetical protein
MSFVSILVLDEARDSPCAFRASKRRCDGRKDRLDRRAAMQSAVGKRVRLRLKVERATVYTFDSESWELRRREHAA